MSATGKLTDLAKRYRGLASEFGYVALAQVFMLIGGLLTIKLTSTLLDKAEYGLYLLLFSVASLLVACLYLPLAQISLRFLIEEKRNSRFDIFYRKQRVMFWVVVAVTAIVSLPFVIYLSRYSGDWSLPYGLVFILTVGLGLQSVQQYQLMAYRLRKSASVAQMVGAISRPLGVVVAIWLLGPKAVYAILGLAVGVAILSLTQFVVLRAPLKASSAPNGSDVSEHNAEAQPELLEEPARTASGYRDYISYGFFHALIGILAAVFLSADRWILSFEESLELVAIHAALMQISLAPVGFAAAILTRLAAPIYFASRTMPVKEQEKRYGLILILWMVMCAGILLLGILFHGFIVRVITNETFTEFSYLLPFMLFAFLLERSAQVLELKGSLLLQTKYYAWVRAVTILLIPILEYAFFKIFGFHGLVAGLIVAAVINFILVLVINAYYLKPVT